MRKILALLCVFTGTVFASDNLIERFKNIDLNSEIKKYKVDELKHMHIDPKKGSAEGEGRQKIEKDLKDNKSIIYKISQTPYASEHEHEVFEDHFSSFYDNISIIIDESGYPTPENDHEANITEAISRIFVAQEIAKSTSMYPGKKIDNKTAATMLKNAEIFKGEQERCYKPIIGVNNCGLKPPFKTSYECVKTSNVFSSYNSCKNSCSDVCKKVIKYDNPKQASILGVEKLAKASDSEKRLAIGKHTDVCRRVRTVNHTKCLIKDWRGRCKLRVKLGEWQYWCCYDSPIAKEFSEIIREQLGMSTKTCSGVPFSRLEEINFNDPRLINVMDNKINKIVDGNMLYDFQDIYKKSDHSDKPAKDMDSDIDKQIKHKNIPGF